MTKLIATENATIQTKTCPACKGNVRTLCPTCGNSRVVRATREPPSPARGVRGQTPPAWPAEEKR